MTAKEAEAIAKKVNYSEYEITLALLEADQKGWSKGYKEASKTMKAALKVASH